MAFFTDKFLNDRREELLRSVDRFQYQLNGGAWQTGTVNSKEIIGTNVVVFVNEAAEKHRAPHKAGGAQDQCFVCCWRYDTAGLLPAHCQH